MEAISGQWDSLLDRSPCNRAFSCSKWFLASCRVATFDSPLVLVARRGPTLAGLLPLVLTDNGKTAEFPCFKSDYNDMIADQDDEPVLLGLLDYALSGVNGYERLSLALLRRDSNCLRALRRLEPNGDVEPFFNGQDVCPYVRLPSSYEEYVASRGRRFRKGLRYALRQASKNNLVVRELEPETFSPDRIPDAFLSMNRSRFGDQSSFEPADGEAFARLLLPDLFTERRMRVFALFREEKMMGMDLCVVGVKSLGAWNGGFLPEAEPWSPGKLLMDAEIRQAYAMRMEEYDLLRGDEAYKASWANSRRDLASLERVIGRPGD